MKYCLGSGYELLSAHDSSVSLVRLFKSNQGGQCSGNIIKVKYDSFIFQVTVKTDDMDLAGDIIQALASFLGIEVDMLPNKKLHLVTHIFYFMKILCRCASVQ